MRIHLVDRAVFPTNTRPVAPVLLLSAALALAVPDAAWSVRGAELEVNKNGVLIRDGKPFRGIGVNYFDLFYRKLKNPNDQSYRGGLKALADRGIPFVRFMACGFWPVDNKLYFSDKMRYFKIMDSLVEAAEENGIGLIPSLFWNMATVPDLVSEPMDQWGNPKSKTHRLMRRYTREVVTRYRSSPAIWGWEFGNEFNLAADLPNAAEHRPSVWPNLGTATSRSKRDDLTHEMMHIAIREFAREVRRHDDRRIIISGNSIPRPSEWHQREELSWKQDSEQEYAEILLYSNPDPVNTICIHFYPPEEKRFDRTVTPDEVLRTTMRIAAKARKPLFVGEFGASGNTETAREEFTKYLDAIIKAGVPLAALWVYDYGGQDDSWNVTPTNSRSYQLDAIAEANRRLRGQPQTSN